MDNTTAWIALAVIAAIIIVAAVILTKRKEDRDQPRSPTPIYPNDKTPTKRR